jgi:hypothetical protein
MLFIIVTIQSSSAESISPPRFLFHGKHCHCSALGCMQEHASYGLGCSFESRKHNAKMQSFHFRQKGITQQLFLFSRSRFYDAHKMFAGSFCDLHFIYFGCVFVSHLPLIASLHIVVVCALFSLLLPHDGLEKFCCCCFVVSFEVL